MLAMKTRGRWLLGLIAGLFLAPWLAAWLLFQHPVSEPRASAAAGQLIDPPVALSMRWHALPGGAPVSAQRVLAGQWSILQFAPTACAQRCRAMLSATRQVRALLHRDAAHVSRVLLVAPGVVPPEIVLQPDLSIYRMNEQSMHTFSSDVGGIDEHTVYLVDPRGQAMMVYPQFQHGDRLRQDLSRLLSLSRMG